MDELEDNPCLLDHLIQSKIAEKHLLSGKIITCAKFDEKYSKCAENQIIEEFPEHIIGCKLFKKEKVKGYSQNRRLQTTFQFFRK